MIKIGIGIGIPFDLRPLVISVFAGAAAAYSMRIPAGSTYSGPLVRVRRSSDNTEADIGAVAGVLNTAALLAHCGTGSGFVSVWYDQSGNGRNVSDATVSDQPRIVNAGVYSGEIDFAASASANRGRLLLASQLNMGAFPYSTNTVIRQMATAPSVVLGHAMGSVQFLRIDGLTSAQFVPGIGYGTSFNASVPVVLTQTNSSFTQATGWANGSNVGSTSGAQAQGVVTDGIGVWNGAQSYFALRELLIFPGAISVPARQALERSQGAAFGITVS